MSATKEYEGIKALPFRAGQTAFIPHRMLAAGREEPIFSHMGSFLLRPIWIC